MRKIRYVRHWVPGSFVSDAHAVKFEGDEEAYRPPAPTYMWDFFSRWETEAPDGLPMQSTPTDLTAQSVYGIVHTLEQVERGGPEYGRALLHNMLANDWKTVVQCAQGMLPADCKIIVAASERPHE